MEALVNLCIEDVGKNKTRLLVFLAIKESNFFCLPYLLDIIPLRVI